MKPRLLSGAEENLLSLGMVLYTCHPGTQRAEAGGYCEFQASYGETLSLIKQKKENKRKGRKKKKRKEETNEEMKEGESEGDREGGREVRREEVRERRKGTLLESIERLSDSAQCGPGHHSPGLGVEKCAPHPFMGPSGF